MAYLNIFGIILGIGFIVLFGFITIAFQVVSGSNSLKNNESIHRFLLISAGIIIGLGFGMQTGDDLSTLIETNENGFGFGITVDNFFIISIGLIILGIILMFFGVNYLRNSLWVPLEHISEYSAEFGNNFIATRLPLSGGIELQRFSQRFNDNVRLLANKISELDIEVDKLNRYTNESIDKGIELANESKTLSDLAINYSDLSNSQYTVVSGLETEINNFVEWYDETKQRLSENFIELRGLSEMGNMIAINAAIEASNLEESNPGFETLATKLRDLARSLEDRQSAMRRLVDEISIKYAEFKSSVAPKMSNAMEISKNTNKVTERLDGIINNIGSKEIEFLDASHSLRKVIDEFDNYIPKSYA